MQENIKSLEEMRTKYLSKASMISKGHRTYNSGFGDIGGIDNMMHSYTEEIPGGKVGGNKI